jgi:hypothetical protein
VTAGKHEPVAEIGGWSVLYEFAGRDVHVVPNGDLIDHQLDQSCPCRPSPEFVARPTGDGRVRVQGGWMHTHHSLDGRELREGDTS